MSSLIGKRIKGQTYYYLREVARVGGKPRVAFSQRAPGKAADIEAAIDGAAAVPERTRHLAFGDVAAVWSMLQRLGVAGIIDEVVGPRRADASASVGSYLALATLNRVIAPCSKVAFADWWATTAADRWVRLPAAALDHRRFWDAMDTVSEAHLAADRGPDRRGAGRAVRAGPGRAGAGHDQLRHLHRHQQPAGPDRPTRAGETETHRPAPGRPGAGGHPRWRHPAAVPRLPWRPARRHPVRRGDRHPGHPLPAGRRWGRSADGSPSTPATTPRTTRTGSRRPSCTTSAAWSAPSTPTCSPSRPAGSPSSTRTASPG